MMRVRSDKRECLGCVFGNERGEELVGVAVADADVDSY
jgi:hypothetical protein